MFCLLKGNSYFTENLYTVVDLNGLSGSITAEGNPD